MSEEDMEKIRKWFETKKAQEPKLSAVINKILAGASESGFNSLEFEQWINQELSNISVSAKKELEGKENAKDKEN